MQCTKDCHEKNQKDYLLHDILFHNSGFVFASRSRRSAPWRLATIDRYLALF